MSRPRIVLLGMMTKIPVAGVVWQTVHYLVGLERLGYETYYVEAHARTPSMLMERPDDDSSARAAAFICGALDRFGFGDRWAYHALHLDGRCYGLSETQLADLYGDPSKRSVVIHAAKRTGDKVCDDFHLVFLHAPGCYRWRADTDATGHERGSSIERNGIPIDRDMRFIQRFLRDLTGQFGLAQVDEHQMVIGAFGRQAKAFTD